MRPAVRGFVSHLAGYAAPHILAALLLSVVAFTTFTPGGESSTRFEAAILQLFIFAVLLGCSGVGYGCAIAFVGRQHASLPLPSVIGTVAGATTFAVGAVGGLSQLARDLGLSVFMAAAVLGFAVGVAASFIVAFTARALPSQRRA